MTYATTFSGIGGWELGLNACGWELKWQCERDAFCRDVLKSRFGKPICPNIVMLFEWIESQFGSIESARIDALIGSPPCQPFSVAGEGRGESDERHLYPSFLNCVRKFKPRWALLEQVPGIFAPEKRDGEIQPAPFGAYIGGLAALGYDCIWHCIPASAVGAAHERDRVWIVAHASGQRLERCEQRQSVSSPKKTAHTKFGYCGSGISNPLDFVAQALCARNDVSVGLVRSEIAPYGNAVCPTIPFLIGQAINQIEGIA